MSKRVLLVRSGAFYTSRLARTARALRDLGLEVRILTWNRGVESDGLPLQSQLEEEGFVIDEVWVGPAPYAQGIRGIPQRIAYIRQVARRMRNNGSFDAVHAIDLDSALPVAFLRMTTGMSSRFVFDIADYIETYYTVPGPISWALSRVSQRVAKAADVIVVPDENRLDALPPSVQKKSIIVTNAPDMKRESIQPASLIDSDSKRIKLFYYGSLSGDRGIELLLESASRLQNASIWFAGWGALEEKVEQAAAEKEPVKHLGMLSSQQVLGVAASMDLIVIAYDPDIEVNQRASPNKLFEAMMLGKPVVVARGTSIDKIVEKYEMGWVIDYHPDSLVRMVGGINKADIVVRGRNSRRAYEVYNWENSRKRLLDAYENLVL